MLCVCVCVFVCLMQLVVLAVLFSQWSGTTRQHLVSPQVCCALLYFYPHDAILAQYLLSSCVCPSIRPSITSRCSTKTAKPRITQTTPYDSPGTLVCWCRRSWRNSNRVKAHWPLLQCCTLLNENILYNTQDPIVYSARSYASPSNWTHSNTTLWCILNGLHAAGYNSAESEPIWMKFRKLSAICWGLAMAEIGAIRAVATVWEGAEKMFFLVR